MLIDLTDHTGTLHSCSLTGSVAEETLGCTVNSKKNENVLRTIPPPYRLFCEYLIQINSLIKRPRKKQS